MLMYEKYLLIIRLIFLDSYLRIKTLTFRLARQIIRIAASARILAIDWHVTVASILAPGTERVKGP